MPAAVIHLFPYVGQFPESSWLSLPLQKTQFQAIPVLHPRADDEDR